MHALCRDPGSAAELQAVAAATPSESVALHTHDQQSGDSCTALAVEFAGVPLDILINNAGVGGSGPRGADFSLAGQEFGTIDYAAWANTMDTNVMGVMRTTETLIPSLLLSQSPKLVHISGIFGSITNQVRESHESPDVPGRIGSRGYFAYRSSKAAMNMVCRMLDVELSPLGVRSIVLHPGGCNGCRRGAQPGCCGCHPARTHWCTLR